VLKSVLEARSGRWVWPKVERASALILTYLALLVVLGAGVAALRADVKRKLAAVYVVSLFGFVIWVGLAISWLFFSGVKPPLTS
jgi:hypothetical protein